MQKIGKYEVIREVGIGGMGKVYQARDPILSRIVAIKLMSEAQLVDGEMRTRFYREAQSAGNLRHPNIITIYDLAEERGVPYIVMEYLEGSDLKQLLKDRPDFPLYDKLRIAVQVANGLSYAHQFGIVHRDIKPGNIRVLEGGHVKIMDFGIAKVAASEMTKTGLTMGTWHYMSPEQIVGKKVDKRSDIWALGVILFEMLAGRRPFEAESITTLVYKIAHDPPPSFESQGVEVAETLALIVSRALAKEAGERYADAADLARELESFIAAMSTSVEQLKTEVERDIRKYLQLATALLVKKQFDEALESARRALTLDPESADAKAMLAQVERERDRTEREQKAVVLADEGKKLLDGAEFEKAVASLKKARELAPESTRIAQMEREVVAEAERRRRAAAVGARIDAAQKAMAASKLSEAAAELRAALDVDPNHVDARKLLAQVNDAARAEAEKKERQEILDKARAAIETKAYAEARRLLEEQLRRKPMDAEARTLLRDVLDAQTMVVESTVMETSVQKEPTAAPARPFDEEPTQSTPVPTIPAKEPRAESVLERTERRGAVAPLPPTEERPQKPRERTVVPPKVVPVREKAAPSRTVYFVVGAAVLAAVVVGVVWWRGNGPPPPKGPPAATGFAAIDVSPWARIVSIKNVASGERVEAAIRETPCFLTLAAGKYEIEFSHPQFSQPFTLSVEVTAGQTVNLRGAVPGFRHEEFLPDF